MFGQPDLRDHRVALVAYIGTDGESYLPDPRDLHVICNPSPGTDPETLRKLMKRGAKVEISDKLHMKVYWSQKRGCIVTSANASSSALGVDGLKEAGIWLPPGTVQIERLIRYAQARRLTSTELYKLDVRFRKHQKHMGNRRISKREPLDFLSWYESPHPSKWKLASYGDLVSGTARAAKKQSLSTYGERDPFTWVSVGKNRASLDFHGTGNR